MPRWNILRVGMEQPFAPVETRPLTPYLWDAGVVYDSREAHPLGQGSSTNVCMTVYEENRQNALDFSRGMNAVLRYLYYALHLSQL